MRTLDDGRWQLDEDETRRKVIELLDGMDMMRMNLWLSSGILAGAIDSEMSARVLHQEIAKRSPHVREYWLDEPCTCGLHL